MVSTAWHQRSLWGSWPSLAVTPCHERLTWEGFLLPKQLIGSARDELRIEAQRLRDELSLTSTEIANRLNVRLGTVRHWLKEANLGKSVLRRNAPPIGTREELLDRYFLTPIGSQVASDLLDVIRFSPVAGVLSEVNNDE